MGNLRPPKSNRQESEKPYEPTDAEVEETIVGRDREMYDDRLGPASRRKTIFDFHKKRLIQVNKEKHEKFQRELEKRGEALDCLREAREKNKDHPDILAELPPDNAPTEQLLAWYSKSFEPAPHVPFPSEGGRPPLEFKDTPEVRKHLESRNVADSDFRNAMRQATEAKRQIANLQADQQSVKELQDKIKEQLRIRDSFKVSDSPVDDKRETENPLLQPGSLHTALSNFGELMVRISQAMSPAPPQEPDSSNSPKPVGDTVETDTPNTESSPPTLTGNVGETVNKPRVLRFLKSQLTIADATLHAWIAGRYPATLNRVDWLSTWLFNIVKDPIFGLVLALVFIIMGVAGANVLVLAAAFAAWLITVLWIARSKLIKSLTIPTRVLALMVFAGAFGLAFYGLSNWAVSRYREQQAQQKLVVPQSTLGDQRSVVTADTPTPTPTSAIQSSPSPASASLPTPSPVRVSSPKTKRRVKHTKPCGWEDALLGRC